MTVDRAGGIECEHVEHYGNEGAHACQRIKLLRGKVNTMIGPGPVKRDPKKGRTDPYCPCVWAMPSDYTQFIIETDDELPAGIGKRMGNEIRRDTVRGGDCCKRMRGSHEDAIQNVPELHHRHCQSRVQWII